MNKRLAVAGVLLVLMLLTIGLCSAAAASASHPRTLKCRIVRHARGHDVTRGYHRVLRVPHGERFVTVRRVPRFRVVRRNHRYVFLRRASRAVVRASTNGVIAAGTPVSVGLPAFASSELPEAAAVAANDGQTATRWAASTRSYPQWWMVDLGSETTIGGVRVGWSNAARRAYRYRIETSLDGMTFTTIRDRSKNQAKGVTTDAVTATARYVRVQVVGVSGPSAPAAADEITVYAGTAATDPPAPEPSPTPSASPTASPTPTPTATPTATPTPSGPYTVAPSGADDTAAIQAAVNACGTRGGTVTFAPGIYRVTSSVKLPPGNTAPLTLSGYGAKIVLDGAIGFLEFNDTADYQSFRYFTVKGFEVDAARRMYISGCALIGATNAFGNYFTKRGNVEYITIEDVYVHGAPAVVGGTCVAIGLGCKQGGVREATTNYVRHITIDDVRIEGGDTGILVMTELTVAGVPPRDQWPADVNQVCDDITISDVHFDSGKVPPFLTRQYHVGIQVNGWGRGGTLDVRDCYLKGSGDDLLEIDNMRVANVTNVYTKESFDIAFTVRGFGYTLDATPPAEGTMRVTYTNCTYEMGTRGAETPTGFGYAWQEINRADHPTYRVTYVDCRDILPDGRVRPYTGP